MELILASGSPRRREILAEAGLEFKIIKAIKGEVLNRELSPIENVKKLAYNKCEEVFLNNQESLVLGADTIVVYQNQIYGKPKDREDAYRMLKKLQGNTHQVMTGVCLRNKDLVKNFVVVSEVIFKEMSDSDIYEYIDTLEPMDKAGSYAIQGLGSKYILGYKGSYENIVGLPIKEVMEALKLF